MVNNEQFLIEPDFNEIGSGAVLEFETGSVNALARAEFNSHVGFYQRQFGTYNYMRFNTKGEYILHYPTGSSLIIQPHNSCAWTPQGDFRMAQKSITPYRMKVNVEQCYDEHFDSTYKYWLNWSGTNVDFSPAGVAATNELTRLIMENTTLGARATLTAGGLFTGELEFTENAPTNIRDAFTRSAGVGQGWIQLLRSLAVRDAGKYGHLDDDNIANADISADGEQYEGDVLALYDARVAAAPRKLRRAVTSGGRGGFGGRNVPIWNVSPSIIEAMYQAKLEQDVAIATNMPRITTQTFQVPTGRGGTAPLMVYYIDQTAVIPCEEIEVFSEYLRGTPHFEYLTLTGVIQLGGSFGSIPERGANNVAVRVQRSQRNEDLGKTTFLAHMLGAVGINDTDYISGGFKFFVPA